MKTHKGLSDHRLSIRILTGTVVFLSVIALLVGARNLLIPLALAILFTCLLNPVVRYFRRRGFGHTGSVIFSVALASFGIGSTSWIVTREFSAVVTAFPEYSHNIREKVRLFKQIGSGKLLERYDTMIREIADEIHPPPPADRTVAIQQWWTSLSTSPSNSNHLNPSIPWMTITGYLGSAAEVLGMIAFTLVLTIFLLLGQMDLRDRLALLAGRSNLALTSFALREASEKISRYLAAVATMNAAFGLTMSAGLYLLGVPYALLAGFMAGLMRFIPYLGPCFGAAFPIIVAIASSSNWQIPLATASLVLTMELICNNVLEPVVFGQSIGVSPFALIVSAGFWMMVWGPIGLILSAPISVCLVVLGQYVRQLRFLSLILGNSPPMEPHQQLYQRLVHGDLPDARQIASRFLRDQGQLDGIDRLLIPTLNHARRDQLKHLLSTEAFREIVRQILELSCEITKEPSQVHQSVDRGDDDSDQPQSFEKKLIVLGCAAGGAADSAAIALLDSVIPAGKWQLHRSPEDLLVSEILAAARDQAPNAIVISSLAPRGVSQAIYITKRLHRFNSKLPIIVARLHSVKPNLVEVDRLKRAGATAVVTSIKDVTLQLNSLYPILFTNADATRSTAVRSLEIARKC